MNFYFCEKCGKRLTDLDVEAGKARDKKANGVFCNSCAKGVLTVEFEALTDQKIQEIRGKLDAAPKATQQARPVSVESTGKLVSVTRESNAQVRPVTRDSNANVHPASRESKMNLRPVAVWARHAVRGSATAAPASVPTIWVAGGVAAVITLVGAVAFSGGGKKAPEHKPPLPEVPVVETRARPEPAPVPEQKRTRVDPPRLRAPETPQVSPVVDAKKTPEETKVVEPAPPVTAPPEVMAPVVPESTPAPVVAQAAPAPPPAPEKKENEAHENYETFHTKFMATLKKRDLETAEGDLKRACADPALNASQKELELDRKALNWTTEVAKALAKGLDSLKDLDDFELVTVTGVTWHFGKHSENTIGEFKDGVVTVNGKGVSVQVPMDTVTPVTRNRLELLGLGNDSSALVCRAFALAWLSNDPQPSSQIRLVLDRARTAGAAMPEIEYVQKILNLEREGVAQAAYEKLPITGDIKALSDAISAFKKSFGNTEFADKKKTELNELENSIRLTEKLSKDLIGFWKMDDGSGTVIKDSSLSGNNGTLAGPIFATGKFGGGLLFSGESELVKVPFEVGAKVADNFTMAFWVNPAATRASTPESDKGVPGVTSQRYVIFPTQAQSAGFPQDHACAGISVGTNGIGVFEHGSGYLPALLNYEKEISGWTHVTVVYINKQPRLYVNGKCVRAGLRSTRIVHPSACLGADKYGNFNGTVDEVRIYSRALTDTEIAELAGYKPVGK